MACTPGDLLNLASCFNCLSQPQLEAIQTYLLCQIQTNGGSSGQQVFSGNGPPGIQVPANNAGIYYDYTNKLTYNWNPTLPGWE
jgi:hypothetical protein